MTLTDTIKQLEELIEDREAFIGTDPEVDDVFSKDKEALEAAVTLLTIIRDSAAVEITADPDGVYYEAADRNGYGARFGTIMKGEAGSEPD